MIVLNYSLYKSSIDDVILMTPEGELKGVVAICQYLVKGTSLAENCNYLEKSQVFIIFISFPIGICCCL